MNLLQNSQTQTFQPLAIAMWDFSWLERRWPGAGYEDWDLALDELVERGYNAVRIDAFPHLLAEDPAKEWTLLPVWNQQVWGSPDINKVSIQPALNTFIAKCKDRKIKVGLSTWFREDTEQVRMKISSPEKMADIWMKTLNTVAQDNLLDAVFYVDLCNEWPGDLWAPFFTNDPPHLTWGNWHTETSMRWMQESIELVRQTYPEIPLCYSFDGNRYEYYVERDLSFLDLLEHHIWMVKQNDNEFNRIIDYKDGLFNPQAYTNSVSRAEKTYREKPEYWRELLVKGIYRLAEAANGAGKPLITTECWGIVDYKDWPLLSWDWVKELCELGVLTAAGTGQWIAIATSNFCGPQFSGMWGDVEWHRNLTAKIKSAPVQQQLWNHKIMGRIR